MKTNITCKHLPETVRNDVEQRITGWAEAHLEPMLAALRFPSAELYATITRLQRESERFRVKLHMHVPRKKILTAQGDDPKPEAALKAAFERLEHELRRHIERVRHQDLYKRKARRKRLREQKARFGGLPQTTVEEANAAIDAVRPRLERAIRRELAYLRAQGDLNPDTPTLEDVLDEVTLNLLNRWDGGLKDQHALYLELLGEMHRVLEREVRENREYGESLSLEEAPPTDAEDQAEAMVGEEQAEFWQPDESLRFEDIIPDDESTDPEAEAEEMEQLSFLLLILKGLPIRWRRVLMLHRMDGIPLSALTPLFGVGEDRPEAWLECARAFSNDKLADAGFGAASGDPFARLGGR